MLPANEDISRIGESKNMGIGKHTSDAGDEQNAFGILNLYEI